MADDTQFSLILTSILTSVADRKMWKPQKSIYNSKKKSLETIKQSWK
jgi:hypothetical protein